MRLVWSGRRKEPTRVVLYTRRGCHLCEEAADALTAAAARLPVLVTAVDIESDDRLLARYAVRIPVVTAAGSGEVLAEGRVDRRELEASLRRISRTR